MIICMSDVLCVTSRVLCKTDFLSRIEEIARCSPAGIILREKDMGPEEYAVLAQKVMETCRRYDVPCILHSFIQTAQMLHADAIHLPLPLLRTMTAEEKSKFSSIGTSCHSAEDAREAQALGCTYITAGHIFATDCKKGVPPRGIHFLTEICKSVSIPVYAIGGIDKSNAGSVRRAGAAGICVMSGLMCCENPAEYMNLLME